MTNLGKQRGQAVPKAIEITNDYVFIASNVQPYTETMDDQTVSGYEYDYVRYEKNEYIEALVQDNSLNAAKIAQLEEELAATKILLGVD